MGSFLVNEDIHYQLQYVTGNTFEMQGHFVADPISWVTQHDTTTDPISWVTVQQISQYFAKITYLPSPKLKHSPPYGEGTGSQPSIFRCDLAWPRPLLGHQDAARSFSPHGGGRGVRYLRNWLVRLSV